MKKLRNILMIIALLASVSFVVAEELTGLYKYETYNEAPIMRVRYGGSASTATFTWSANGFTTVEGDTTTIHTNVANDTVAVLQAAINAVEDADDKKFWTAFPCAALSTDDIDAADLTAAAAAIDMRDHKWHEVMTVDTTALDYNDVCPWKWQQGSRNAGDIILKSVYGAPGGTGAATVTVYVDDSPIWQTLVSTNVPAGVAEVIDISREFTLDGAGLRVKNGGAPGTGHVVIRCDRTTSTDVGGIGVGYSMDK